MPKPKSGRASRIRLPLKLKLSLLITALLVVTVTFLSAFLLYRAERSLIAQMTKRGLTIAQHLANAAKNPLLNDDGLTLNLLVKDAMNDADVAYAIVPDPDGKTVAHPDVTLIGRPLERPTGLARLGDDLLIQTYTDLDNERIMDFAIPLTFRKVPVGADRHLAESEGDREVHDPLIVQVGVGLDQQIVSQPRQPGRSLERPADEGDVRMGDGLAVGIGDDRVGHVRVVHGVLDQEIQRQPVVVEQRVLGGAGPVPGDGEAALGHLRDEAPLGTVEEEGAQEGHRHHQQRGDEQAELELQRQADPRRATGFWLWHPPSFSATDASRASIRL